MQKNRRLSVPIYQVDAFAGKAFSGNPAAVCWLENEIDELLMQSIAAEMNLSETAFVYSVNDGFNLRWFTPSIEVDLCGHATLAAAHILWEQGKLPMDEIASFHTRSGILLAKYSQDGIVLDFPSVPAIKCDVPDGLLQALGVSVKGDKSVEVLFNQSDYLVRLDDEDQLYTLRPDFTTLATIKARGVMVTAESHQTGYDFISRFFAPAAGINEDPVTGSAHCTLAPYWAERIGKNKMHAFQASKRGGEVTVELKKERVLLTGQAITVLAGRLNV